MLELSKVGCEDLQIFCEFFGAGEQEDTLVLVH